MAAGLRQWLWACTLLSCACAVLPAASPAASAAGAIASGAADRKQPAICMVVRTYWGHGGDGGLRRLLTSLQQQSNPK